MVTKRAQKEEVAVDEPKLEEETVAAPEEAETPVAPEGLAPQADTPSPALAVVAPIGSKARAMREKLAAEDKVRVFIPLAAGEKQGVTQSVILNGYPMYIRKGTYVEVPASVADVLEAKLKHKMSVENHPSRITNDGKVELTSYGN